MHKSYSETHQQQTFIASYTAYNTSVTISLISRLYVVTKAYSSGVPPTTLELAYLVGKIFHRLYKFFLLLLQ